MPVTYNFEYEKKLRVGFVGCGGHSWRNVYPTFQYAPVELICVADYDVQRAESFARQFGAERHYASHREMLEREQLDAVFVVTSYDENGHPQAAPIAIDALEAGCHVWMEKPPAASVAQVNALIETSEKSGKVVLVGFKKMFFPSIEKAKEIVESPEFGRPTSIYIRYPQSIPDDGGRRDDKRMIGFLDHIVHPGSILLYLMGPISDISFLREGRNGASVATMRFTSGAVGTMHLTAGQSGTSPLERLEVVGEGANVVVDNGVDVTYYRKGQRGRYGRAGNYLVPNDQAPLKWEPEFSLGQLYNKNLFLLGYAREVQYFCECVFKGEQPQKAGLNDALELLKLYEAYRGPEATQIAL